MWYFVALQLFVLVFCVFQLFIVVFCCFAVVYEDRSRLENSLQKARNEHQATKDGECYFYSWKSLGEIAAFEGHCWLNLISKN